MTFIYTNVRTDTLEWRLTFSVLQPLPPSLLVPFPYLGTKPKEVERDGEGFRGKGPGRRTTGSPQMGTSFVCPSNPGSPRNGRERKCFTNVPETNALSYTLSLGVRRRLKRRHLVTILSCAPSTPKLVTKTNSIGTDTWEPSRNIGVSILMGSNFWWRNLGRWMRSTQTLHGCV